MGLFRYSSSLRILETLRESDRASLLNSRMAWCHRSRKMYCQDGVYYGARRGLEPCSGKRIAAILSSDCIASSFIAQRARPTSTILFT